MFNPTRAPPRPKPPGIETWYELLGPHGAPQPGQRGYVEGPEMPALREDAAALVARACALWEDPSLGPLVQQILFLFGSLPDYEGDLIEDWRDYAGAEGVRPSELAHLLGVPWLRLRETTDFVGRVAASEACGGWEESAWDIQLAAEDLLLRAIPKGTALRLTNVGPETAQAFVAAHHSALPGWNDRGLLYTLGLKVGTRLHAVAVANTPTGRLERGRPAAPGQPFCPFDGMVEITRVASDGLVLGAASKLVARLIDILPASGRPQLQPDGTWRPTVGCLLLTYSFPEEAGITYLALVDKGLRPVGWSKGHGGGGGGARGHTERRARPESDKIIWEAGPAARVPDWSTLEGRATPVRIWHADQALRRFYARQYPGVPANWPPPLEPRVEAPPTLPPPPPQAYAPTSEPPSDAPLPRNWLARAIHGPTAPVRAAPKRRRRR